MKKEEAHALLHDLDRKMENAYSTLAARKRAAAAVKQQVEKVEQQHTSQQQRLRAQLIQLEQQFHGWEKARKEAVQQLLLPNSFLEQLQQQLREAPVQLEAEAAVLQADLQRAKSMQEAAIKEQLGRDGPPRSEEVVLLQAKLESSQAMLTELQQKHEQLKMLESLHVCQKVQQHLMRAISPEKKQEDMQAEVSALVQAELDSLAEEVEKHPAVREAARLLNQAQQENVGIVYDRLKNDLDALTQAVEAAQLAVQIERATNTAHARGGRHLVLSTAP